MLLRPVVRELIADTRTARSHLAKTSPEWEFLLGVEAAANAFLHPEIAGARATNWLDNESAPFRDGYLTAEADIRAAVEAPSPPLRLSPPVMPARRQPRTG